MSRPLSLTDMAVAVLSTADARDKAALSRVHAAAWLDARADGTAPAIGHAAPPAQPARPARPEVLDPRDVLGPDCTAETFAALIRAEQRLYGEYRTRRLLLAAWDRLESLSDTLSAKEAS